MNERDQTRHQVPGLHDLDAHDGYDHVAAIFDSRPTAIVAADDLREAGLGSEHLGIAARGGRRAEIERIFEHHGGRRFPLDATLSA